MRPTHLLLGTLLLFGACGGAATTPSTTTAGNAAGDTASIDPDVRQVDATTFEISRVLLDRALASTQAEGSTVRAVEFREGDAVIGFKLFGIEADSPFDRLGLTVGDIITVINGTAVTSSDALMQAHGSLGTAAAFDLELRRDGAPLVLHYSVR